MKQCLLLQDHEIQTNKQLLHAFEEVVLEKGKEISSSNDGNYFYVVEEGNLDFQVDGKTVGSAKVGDAFGALDLLYGHDKKIRTIVANTQDTKIIRLDQKSFRGIVQSQFKQDEEEKRALLQKIPFLKDLLYDKDGNEINKDTTNRLCRFMKPQLFHKSDTMGTRQQRIRFIWYKPE
jgi:cAMP-dependent protein kinase regulator